MDGNGRWAKKRFLPRVFGHKRGVKTVKNIVKASDSLGIKVLTLYAFSTENWKRPHEEIDALFDLLLAFLKKEFSELNAKGVQLRILGDISRFPKNVQNEIEKACRASLQNSGLQLNIALNYGSRHEILRAYELMRKYGIENPTEEQFSSFLYTKGQPDPDLLIRTSGEMRLSNFMLWQMAYGEIYITDKFWPDFTKQDLEDAITEYHKRERRYGGV
jgi:undecaprenyl diphosphate synthase